jgi:hypothetical protein
MSKDIITEISEFRIGLFLLGILVLCFILEAGLLAYAYFNADSVTCNLLWCEFTQERTNMESRSECYVNGERINCSQRENETINFFENKGLDKDTIEDLMRTTYKR